MKVWEFQAQLTPDQTLKVPEAVAREIAQEDALRVVLLLAQSADNRDWSELTAQQFLQGYSEGDAIYDQLSAG